MIIKHRSPLFRIYLLTLSLSLFNPKPAQAEVSAALVTCIAASNFISLCYSYRCGLFAEHKLCSKCKKNKIKKESNSPSDDNKENKKDIS